MAGFLRVHLPITDGLGASFAEFFLVHLENGGLSGNSSTAARESGLPVEKPERIALTKIAWAPTIASAS
jgi:hypothetical protein